MSFFGYEKKKKCEACAVYESQIEYLKGQIDRLVKERESERAEYKRAVDVILYKEKVPAIGQGYTEPAEKVDPTKLFTFFEEEIKEKS